MKKLIYLSVLVFGIFIGCQEDIAPEPSLNCTDLANGLNENDLWFVK